MVYYSTYSKKDIIHRAVAKLKVEDGYYFLTKGDANARLDQECFVFGSNYYCIHPFPVKSTELKGKAIFKIPLIGYAKLLIFDDLPRILRGESLEEFP